LGDRIAVLKEGVLQQVASPMELYERPANKFVASFIGSPGMNFFSGTLSPTGSEGRCTFRGSDLSVGVPCAAASPGSVFLGVRPHDLEIIGDATAGEGIIKGEVSVVEPMGNEQILYLTLSAGGRAVAVAPVQPRLSAGERVTIRVRAQGLHVFDAQSGNRLG
jgi:multiple sugar transport system ATP-binding protein